MPDNLIPANWTSSHCDTLREKLQVHPLYGAINNQRNLRIFMQHHVYAVWDFMSLIKAMQYHLAPTTIPWIPPKNAVFANYINQLVLEEESDNALDTTGVPVSHFESYIKAMNEIGGDIAPISTFISAIDETGLEAALDNHSIPVPAKNFMAFTFKIIKQNQLHLLATILAHGREALIPLLFRSIQQKIGISQADAPNLHAYLNRHIQLDEQEHGPIVLRMVQKLCADSNTKRIEAIEVAEQALCARLQFWDGIYQALN